MRTLFLNPPSFEGFDGGAGSRWPASREIESYWYPVWLGYPAGMLEDSKVVDGPPHKVSIEQTVAMAKDFELLVLYTSSPGFHVDVKIADMMKDANSKLQVAFVGPPVTIEPEKALHATKAIDFVVRREFDHQIVDYANGKPLAYNAAASSGSNLGPTNPALVDAAKARIDALKAVDPENAQPIPVDLVTASASGLDPHISPAAADYQIPRVARARKIPEAQVADLVARCVEGRQLGVLGEPRVNVLRLNLALDHPELAPPEPGRAAPSDHELHTTRGRGFMP